MRVLVTGRAIPHQPTTSTGQQLVAGFEQAGHTAVFYGNFYGEPYRCLGMKEAASNEFDLVVITECNDGYPGYNRFLDLSVNLNKIPRIYWDFDVSYHPETSLSRATLYKPDAFLVANKYFLGTDGFGRYNKPILHLPYACSPQLHHRKPKIERKYLLGFVGSLTKERIDLLDYLRKYINNTADMHNADGVFGEKLVDKTNEFYTMFHKNQDACAGLVPGRPFETTGCGTTLLMDRASYIDFAELLRDDIRDELFVYDNNNDLLRWATEYQDKRAELDIRGTNLMYYIHKNHSYKNRAEQIIRFAQENKII